MKRRFISLMLALCMVFAMLPASAGAEPALMRSGNLDTAGPTKDQIRAKWAEVTTSETAFDTAPSVAAPYATGKLNDSFLENGITYLNYVRYVANLPQVRLSDALNENAQYGAVLLAAIDQLTHYPSQPEDMDYEFYRQGYTATTSSNLSMRYNTVDSLQSSVQGCMDDLGLNNLAAVGHRRWLLNPTLLNVGFGYAKSTSGKSYIATKVFDRSGAAVDYDFISWPASGNFPTNLFSTDVPWSVSLNPAKYQTPNLSQLQVTITQEHGGKVWSFDASTGEPVSTETPYMVVNTIGYGVNNCIIFHPGSDNVFKYEGIFTVEISGIYTRDGAATTIRYQVDFFNLDGSGDDTEHVYAPEVTVPATCEEPGHTAYTCVGCGHSYSAEIPALGHDYFLYVESYPTATSPGWRYYFCTRYDCNSYYGETIPATHTHSYRGSVVDPTCTEEGYTTYTCACGDTYVTDRVAAKGHDYTAAVTDPTCTAEGYTTYTCVCGDTYVADWVAAKGHTPGAAATCTTAQTCTVCDAELAPARGHNWAAATCTTPKTCSVCKATKGKTTGHIYGNNVDGTCNVCGIHRENVETRQVVHMFRMYNPNTGEHFYTGSTVERDNLIAVGWQYEGVGFTFPANTGAPVHRLFQPSTGEHLYTMDEAEKDCLMAEGWNYEGIAFNSAYDTEAVQHRLHNPNATVGAYHFTFSAEEKQTLIDAGWEYQGIGWYSCWK